MNYLLTVVFVFTVISISLLALDYVLLIAMFFLFGVAKWDIWCFVIFLSIVNFFVIKKILDWEIFK